MNLLMATILSLSISGSLLIVFLFLLKPIFKAKFSKRWQYYVWLIVLGRLLLPFSLEANFVGGLFNHIGQADFLNDISYSSFILQQVNHTQNMQTSFTFMSSAWLLWLIVAMVLFVRKITIYQSFVRYIKAGLAPVTDIKNLERFGKIIEEANIHGVVGIYTNTLISSPLLIGFFRPYIVLPTLELSDSDFRYTVLHELTHYKRGDMFYKWLVQMTICIHWFNPLVYIMGNEINSACEFSCDEAVVKNLEQVEIMAYGNTLINAIALGKYKSSVSSVTLNGCKEILKERLDMLLNLQKTSVFITGTAFFTTVFLIAGAVVAGAYTNNNHITGFMNTSVNIINPPLNQHIFIKNLQLGDSFTYNLAHEDLFLTIMVANSTEASDMTHIIYFSEREHNSHGSFTVYNDAGKYLLIFPTGTGREINGTIIKE